MAYYSNRQINKIVKDVIDNYCPPSTYKNKMPTKEEFSIQNIDIDKIEKEYNSFDKKKNAIETFLGVAWFALGGIPAGYVSVYICEAMNLSTDSFIPIIIFMALYFLGFGVIGLTDYIKYNKKEEYENIKKYKEAMSQYYWWQNRKKKDFWYSLDGRKFEIEIANIFKKIGYKTKICKQGGDEGVDIEIEKNGNKEIIQCKAHKAKVSPSVARDLLGTMLNKKVNHAYLVTLNGGTAGTIDFCKKNNITLWDIDDIIGYNKM